MEETYIYKLKDSLITETEKPYLEAVKEVLPEGYVLQPQVNLASIIERTDGAVYHNELFRNIDACIFDTSYKPVLLIEINDQSHSDSKRKSRDAKVKAICEEAGIQLVAFWTKYGVNKDYISKKISEGIKAAPDIKRKPHDPELFGGSSKKKQDITENADEEVSYSADSGTSIGTPESIKHYGKEKKEGCYVATAVYGSYDCPQVWVLRRFRDEWLYGFSAGRAFIKLYYAVSPKLVRLFGKSRVFNSTVKCLLDKMVLRLKQRGYSDERYNDIIR